MKREKQAISLIVLVITIISTYDELIKIDRIPPKKKIEKIVDICKVVDFKFTTFICKHFIV